MTAQFVILAPNSPFPNVFIGNVIPAAYLVIPECLYREHHSRERNVIPECLYRERHSRERNVIPAEAGIQVLTMTKQPCVYIMASQRNGTLYIGVSSDLVKRVWQHKNHVYEGFTDKNNVCMLVWYEHHPTMESAIAREKSLKKWYRKWKLELIESKNPQWEDLYGRIAAY